MLTQVVQFAFDLFLASAHFAQRFLLRGWALGEHHLLHFSSVHVQIVGPCPYVLQEVDGLRKADGLQVWKDRHEPHQECFSSFLGPWSCHKAF